MNDAGLFQSWLRDRIASDPQIAADLDAMEDAELDYFTLHALAAWCSATGRDVRATLYPPDRKGMRNLLIDPGLFIGLLPPLFDSHRKDAEAALPDFIRATRAGHLQLDDCATLYDPFWDHMVEQQDRRLAAFMAAHEAHMRQRLPMTEGHYEQAVRCGMVVCNPYRRSRSS